MEGAGVVVGDWVEWWSGIGWSGGRGLGGVMVEDWLGDGLGCGGCWSGCVVGVGSYMALAAGEGECVCELLVWLVWCPELYTLNTSPLETKMAPEPVASMRVYISLAVRNHIAMDAHGGTPGPPASNFYIAKMPAPEFFEPDPLGGFQNHRRVLKIDDFHWQLLLFQYHLIACPRSP